TVTPVNDAPTATGTPLTTGEDSPASGTIVGNDLDGDELTYTVGTPPANGTLVLDPESGEYTYTPNDDFNGDDSFTVIVDDGNGGTTTVNIPVTVTPVNDPPTATGTPLTTDEDTPVNGTIVGEDVDGDELTYTVGTPPTNGTLVLDPETGEYTYTPNDDFNGDDSFTVIVDDGNGGTATVDVPVTVVAVNDAPVAQDGGGTTGENLVLISNVPAATDVDGTVSGYTLVDDVGTGNGSLSFNPDGTYSFDPGSDFDDLPAGATRVVTFTYTATDDDGAVSAPATVTITVTGTNDAPVAQDDTGATEENTILDGNVPAATDIDGTIVGYTLVDGVGPGLGAPRSNPDGTYSFDPGSDFDALTAG